MDLNLRRRRSRALDDADVVGLLRGAAPAERPDLAGAAALVAALRDLPVDAPEPRGALAALLREGFDPATLTPAGHVAVSPVTASGARRTAVRLAGVSLAAKALLGTGVAFAGVAAAATGGVLPDAVSDRVTRIVELVTPGSTDDRGPQAPAVVPEEVRQDGGTPAEDRRQDGDAPAVTVPGPRLPAVPPQVPRQAPPATGDDAADRRGSRPTEQPQERDAPRQGEPRDGLRGGQDDGAPDREGGQRAPGGTAPGGSRDDETGQRDGDGATPPPREPSRDNGSAGSDDADAPAQGEAADVSAEIGGSGTSDAGSTASRR